MRILLTGATGFIGFHVATLLRAKGAEVRCLVRRPEAADFLLPLEVDLVKGDLKDAVSVRQAMDGVEQVFHCAADYRLFARDPEELYQTNVEGTRNVCRSAVELGVSRLVYTSSVGALGKTPDGRAADENTPVFEEDMIGHYKLSKFLGEREVQDWMARGLPAVIVSPSTPIGEADRKPTPTGRIILDFLNGKVPAYVDTGLNWIDVRDVAQGHWAASQMGQVGRSYILGHQNLSLRDFYRLLAKVSGRTAPRVRLPHWIPLAAGAVSTTWAKAFGGQPRVPLEAVRMARRPMYFDASRAVRELGLPQSPIEPALERGVRWYETNGYLGSAGKAMAR